MPDFIYPLLPLIDPIGTLFVVAVTLLNAVVQIVLGMREKIATKQLEKQSNSDSDDSASFDWIRSKSEHVENKQRNWMDVKPEETGRQPTKPQTYGSIEYPPVEPQTAVAQPTPYPFSVFAQGTGQPLASIASFTGVERPEFGAPSSIIANGLTHIAHQVDPRPHLTVFSLPKIPKLSLSAPSITPTRKLTTVPSARLRLRSAQRASVAFKPGVVGDGWGADSRAQRLHSRVPAVKWPIIDLTDSVGEDARGGPGASLKIVADSEDPQEGVVRLAERADMHLRFCDVESGATGSLYICFDN